MVKSIKNSIIAQDKGSIEGSSIDIKLEKKKSKIQGFWIGVASSIVATLLYEFILKKYF